MKPFWIGVGSEGSLVLLEFRKEVTKGKLTSQGHTSNGVDPVRIVGIRFRSFELSKNILKAL